MTNEETYKMIGQRAEELVNNSEIQKKMVQLTKEKGQEEAEKWLYMVAIATLFGA